MFTRGPLRALQYPAYRLYLLGMILSFTGTWAQNMAMGWLVYDGLTQDSFKLAMVTFAGQIPTLLFGLIAGILVDRYDRRKLIIAAQWVFLVQGLALVYLTVMRNAQGGPLITFPMIMALAFLGGMAMCLDQAARVAYVAELVPAKELSNAVALSSLAFNGARIFGPVLAGWLVAQAALYAPSYPALGEGLSFGFNMITNVFVIGILWWLSFRRLVQPAAHTATASSEPLGVKFRQGFLYLRHRTYLLALMLFNGAMAVVAIPYLILMPVYAREGLGGDASTLSHLMASVGVGAILGGVVMASRKSIQGLARHIGFSAFGFSAAVAMAAITTAPLQACLIMMVAGFFMVMAMIGSNTLAQVLTHSQYRGRVLALFNISTVGLMPAGSLLMGYLAKATNIQTAFMACSVLTLAVIGAFSVRLAGLRTMARQSDEYKAAVGELETTSS
jgi:MFS family permease